MLEPSELPIRMIPVGSEPLTDFETELLLRDIYTGLQKQLEANPRFARPKSFRSSDEQLANELIDLIAR